jgi:pimeloyl-ACP methyl ester carboxylesterase
MPDTTLSRTVDLDGHTHFVDFGGSDGSSPLVLVHGLGGSHSNWLAVGPTLAEDHRVLAIDLAGHGLTFPDQRRTDVDSNQRLLDRFLRQVVGEPVILTGNSMGGMISILQTARNPETVRALVLVDPAVPGPPQRLDPRVARNFLTYSLPGLANAALAARRRRMSPPEQVQQVLDLCCVDPGRVPDDVVERAVELATRRQHVDGIDSAFLDAARSVMLHLARRTRLQAAMREVSVPVLLLQGDRDRLVPLEAAHQAARDNPDWELHVAEGVGHVPMLEAPQWFLDTYRDWAARTGLTRHISG